MIPFNRPVIHGREHLEAVLASSHHGADGVMTTACSKLLERELGARSVLLTTSCSDALEIAALLVDIEPGDEVIVPSFTFVSTANAFAIRGAKIVFADVRPDTCNLDMDHVAKLVTPKTRAIVPVHYAGVGCDMQALDAIARPKNIAIVEDNAHGLFGKAQGRALGSFGCVSTLSFHETKNFSCGEGGAIVINDEEMVERAIVVRQKGTDRSRFFRGLVDKYTWQDVGSSFALSDILAALLLGQLEARSQIQSLRSTIWNTYHRELAAWAERSGVRRPTVPEGCEQPAHLYYLVLPNLSARQALIAHLKQRGVSAVFHYQALHNSPMGQRFGGGSCPVSETLGDCLVRLPLHNAMTEQDTATVVEAVTDFSIS